MEAASLTYTQAPIDNPLKGMAFDINQAYIDNPGFPTSFHYGAICFSDIVNVTSNSYDWTALENKLNLVTNTGGTYSPQFYLELPDYKPEYNYSIYHNTNIIPAYLFALGLVTSNYLVTESEYGYCYR